ncbi:MAG: Holliday junction branch migration protein RuvA [Candidatus Staskawiczbacteria bacterium]|jgi:Holliday junction DNA helicase RuvA
MISYLNGKLILRKEKNIVIDVNGVGYKVFLSKKSILNLPEIGQSIKLFCFLDVKENGLDLYGFFDEKELDFFDILNSIRGIGPKAAIELSSLGPLDTIKERILNQDEKLFSSIPGIGAKKAMTIILELTGKIRNISKDKVSARDEAEDTLSGLGFPKQKIREALDQLPEDIKDNQERIKQALKVLGRK